MNIKRLLLNVSLSAGLLVCGIAWAGFTPGQTQDIEKIIHDYLVSNPKVLIEASQSLQKQQQEELVVNARKVINEKQKELFSSKSPVAGNSKGDVTLVEFFDYQCIHCRNVAPEIKKLTAQDKKLRIVHKQLPIFGKVSNYAARAALASYKQSKYSKLHEKLMTIKTPLTEEKILDAAKASGLNISKLKKDMDSDAVKNELKANLLLANELGIRGTPSFVIADYPAKANKELKSFFVPGAAKRDALIKFIKDARS